MATSTLSRTAKWAAGIIGTLASLVAIIVGINSLINPTGVNVEVIQITQIASATKHTVARQPAIAIERPAAPLAPKPTPLASEENNPLQLADKQSRFSKLADADISAVFNNFQGRQFAKLTVAADGKEPVFLPIHGAGQSLTFASKTGEYIASIVNVDFDSKTLEVRVSKKN